jgi:regulator of sigma E protease
MSEIISWFLTNPFVAFIALVGVVVFVHELGHFLAGIWMNIAVEEFSLGFGPTAWSFKRGRTEYKICWLPLGGYVRFYGQDSTEAPVPELEGRALNTAPVYKRSIISFAGPFANFVLSLIVMIILSNVGLPQPSPVVSVMPEGAARSAGLLTGDKILKIDDEPVRTWADINRMISARPEKPTRILLERGAETVSLDLTPAKEMSENLFGEPQAVGRIGVSQFFETPWIVLAPRTTPLTRAGAQSGDRVVEVNGRKISALHELEHALLAGPATLKVERRPSVTLASLLEAEKNKQLANVETHTLQVTERLSAEDWNETVRSTDMTIRAFDDLNQGDRKIPARDAWQSCGLRAGDTLMRWEQVPQLRGPVGLSFAFHKLSSATDTGAVAVNWQVLGLEDNQLRTLNCTIPRRAGLDPLSRDQFLVDLPVSFVTRGVAIPPVIVQSETLLQSFEDGFAATWKQTTTIFTALKKLVSGSVPLSNLGGPIAIARVAGDAAEGGFLIFILTISWMSVNIGLFNLLPLPALDGGHLLLQGVEAAYGKPLPESVQLAVQRVGVAILLGLIVVVFFNDILRLFRS